MNQEINQYSVLFIEDEKAIRDNYVNYLQKHFKNVYEAEDGESAYEIYKSKRPELLIVDINIPKLNGLELLKRIRQTDKETRAIVLTAHADIKYLLAATELNLTKYLVKPITRKDLKDALSIALEDMKNFTVRSNKHIHLKENFTWNQDEKILYNGEYVVNLTKTEAEIFAYLFSNLKRVVTYEDCILKIWGYHEDNKVDSFKTLIKNIRKKLPKDTILNVFGVGYKVVI